MNKIILNDWDLERIEKKGFVESGKYVVMTKDKFKKLLNY